MTECSFLSTYEYGIECFKECPLYNYKGNGGKCPFTSVDFYKANKYDDDFENEIRLVKEYY